MRPICLAALRLMMNFELLRLLHRELRGESNGSKVLFVFFLTLGSHAHTTAQFRSKVCKSVFGIEPSFFSIMVRLIVLNIAVATEGKSNPASFQLAIE